MILQWQKSACGSKTFRLGRAVSKTVGSGFKSLCPCQNLQKVVRKWTTFLLYINKKSAITEQSFEHIHLPFPLFPSLSRSICNTNCNKHCNITISSDPLCGLPLADYYIPRLKGELLWETSSGEITVRGLSLNARMEHGLPE